MGLALPCVSCSWLGVSPCPWPSPCAWRALAAWPCSRRWPSSFWRRLWLRLRLWLRRWLVRRLGCRQLVGDGGDALHQRGEVCVALVDERLDLGLKRGHLVLERVDQSGHAVTDFLLPCH